MVARSPVLFGDGDGADAERAGVGRQLDLVASLDDWHGMGRGRGRTPALLHRGRRELSRYGVPLSEEDYRFLHDTHGLPRELVDLLLEASGSS